MNSNLNRALSAALLALGGVAPALAQSDSSVYCIDFNNSAPYSADFINYQQRTQLFGAELGISGTVSYLPSPSICAGGGPVAGRIGFTLGATGSYQDDDPNQAGQYIVTNYLSPTQTSTKQAHDNFLELTRGANFGNDSALDLRGPGVMYPGFYTESPTGGNSFARIYVDRTPSGSATRTRNSYLFGGTAFTYAFFGRSGRYVLAEGPVTTGITTRLVMDVLGDAARLNWTITDNINTTDTVAVGLYFGQIVTLFDQDGTENYVRYGLGDQTFLTNYITIPGRRPLSVDERFNSTGLGPNGEVEGATVGIPPYVNFTQSRSAGWGLQVVNNSSALTGFDATSGLDQTPVDEFVVGTERFLIDGTYNATNPTFGDFIFNTPGNGTTDAAPIGFNPAFLQKWQPTAVTNGTSRTITAYYRATNFDTSYSSGAFLGYSVAVDTPKAIPASRNPDVPYTIRVHVDNTGGFSDANAPVTLQSTTVTLYLPAGLYNPADGSRIITKSIPLINITDIGTVDFLVQIDPNVSGPQTYRVTVTPQSGSTGNGSVQTGFLPKTVTGSINVAASPRLYIASGANLVSPPWQFNDSSWESVLGLSLNADFQAYAWDSLRQQYVAQPAAQRGIGTWIISQSQIGYKILGGTPKQPDDQFPDDSNLDIVPGAGSPSVLLHTGWNLVGNPYNYAFPIGNLVGVAVSGNKSYTFDQLKSLNFTDGSLAYYDQTNRAYSFLSNDSATAMPPNSGYWIFANTDFYLQFPPLFETFLRAAPGTSVEKQRSDNWRLQLSATSASTADTDNFVGIAPDGVTARTSSVRKPPMVLAAKTADVLSAYVTGDGGASMAKSIRASRGSQTFTFNVLTKNGGPVTVSWPNLKAIPSNLTVKITDRAKNRTIDARNAAGYTVTAKASTVYPLTVTVAPVPVAPERITTASYSYVTVNGKKQMRVSFSTTGRGSATVTAGRGSSVVKTVASDVDIIAGQNSVVWDLTDAKGQAVPNGSYVVTIKAVGEDGSIATRQIPVTVRR